VAAVRRELLILLVTEAMELIPFLALSLLLVVEVEVLAVAHLKQVFLAALVVAELGL